MNDRIASELSESLIGLMNQFSQYTKSGLDMTPSEVSNVVTMLAFMHRLSVSMEQELNCHRMAEANRFAGDMVENLSTETLGDLLLETDGNIIRPRFGRDPQSS